MRWALGEGCAKMGSWRRAWPGRMDVRHSVKSLRWPDPGQLVGCMLPLSTVLGGHTCYVLSPPPSSFLLLLDLDFTLLNRSDSLDCVLLHLVILRSSSLLMLTVLIIFNPIMIHLTIKIPAAHIYWHFPHARHWVMAVFERAGTRSLSCSLLSLSGTQDTGWNTVRARQTCGVNIPSVSAASVS